jgi:biopolymer transport protein ExbB/biopolymer transport protein TolQ
MSLAELLRHVGIFGGAVIVCLALLSVFSVGMIIDKHRRFSSASRESEKFKLEFKKFLHGGDVKDLIEAGQLHQNSYVAQVVSAGIIEYDSVGQNGGDPAASLELVTSALRDSMSETLIQLKRGLGFLATIGSTAPFVGLFGTVVGIINAFRSIAATGPAECLWFRAASLRPWSRRPWVSSSQFRPSSPSTTSRARIETFHVEMNRASSQLVNRLFKIPELKGLDVEEWMKSEAPTVKRRAGLCDSVSQPGCKRPSTSRRSSTWCWCC